MRIVNLIENTEGKPGLAHAHGLAFYVETAAHRLLMDTGPSAETLANAEKLGVDLKQVDLVILSHGHYDHSGGLLPFAAVNPEARIYMQKTAPGEHYSRNGDTYRYIGIDSAIPSLPQVTLVDGSQIIDDELSLFVVEKREGSLPFTNARLKQKRGEEYVQDEFSHEQSLVLRQGGRRILFSGCAHNGILNILKAYRKSFGSDPDAVISGFHLMQKADYSAAEEESIREMAVELKQYPTVFYTCHCTGLPAYRIMKEILGEQLTYVHSGDEVRLDFKEVVHETPDRRNTTV